jgi:flagellar motor switch protein FliM
MAENEADDTAAEWAAMLDEEGKDEKPSAAAETAAEPAQPARVLNQDEIDLLLGFDAVDTGSENVTGIKAILDRALMAYEKMPMLEIVFDRLVRQLSSSLRNFTSDNVDVGLDSMVSLRFEDYLNGIPLPALLVVFRALEWENFGLVMVDSSLIYSTVDVLFGGRKSNKPIRIEGRPYTTIEQDIVKRMVDVVLGDLSAAFDPLSPVTFQYDRLENNPRFATISRPNTPALLVRLRVDMEERGGIIEILLPHTTLEPIRDLLLQMFMGERFGQDTVWERHLGQELRQTNMDVDAVLDEKTIPLGEALNFKVGNTLMLDVTQKSPVKLKCGHVLLAEAKLGKTGDYIAVSLNEGIKATRKELNI